MLYRSFVLVCLLMVASWNSFAQTAPALPARDASAGEAVVAENLCTLKTEEDGVKAFTCENKDSKFRMVKVQFDVDTTPELFAAALFDMPGYNNWQYRTINAALVQQISETELIYYAEFVAPWPFTNRDVYARLRMERTGTNLKFFYNGIPDFMPEKDGITRIASSASSIEVIMITPPNASGSGGRIQVEFNSNVDPGGYLPPFLMNQFAGEGPFESFRALRKQLNLEAEKIVAGTK